jgi:hypothetical protein
MDVSRGDAIHPLSIAVPCPILFAFFAKRVGNHWSWFFQYPSSFLPTLSPENKKQVLRLASLPQDD